MINFILIILCLAAGILVSVNKMLPKDSYKSINVWILYIALPAISLRYVPAIEWSVHMLLPCIAPFVIWFGAWAMVKLYSAKREISNETKTALLITGGLSNTSFLGFPLIAAYFGEGEIKNAIIFDQISFIIFSTLAVVAVMQASNNKQHVGVMPILKKISVFPPFLGCVSALVIPLFIDISPINPLLDKLVATVSPLALFSIGLQLKIKGWRQEAKHLSVGLIYKLLIAPILVTALVFIMGVHGSLAKISIFEAAMPTHITGSLLASQYNMNPRLCNLMVGAGIIIGFATTACWWLILGYLPI